jgi:hypothetical protein
MVRRLAVAGTIVALCAVLAGCGGSGGSDASKPATGVPNDQRDILATVDALQTASRRDDARKICGEIFSRSLVKSIRKASKHSCEAEVHESLTSPDAQLSIARKIDIKGSLATTLIREQNGNTSTITFVKEDGSWRIARVTPVKSSSP